MRYIGFVLLFLTLILPVSAQSDWAVVEHCVEQTHAPEGWTYDGTILLRGTEGLYGVSADWESPRVVAKIPRYDGLGYALSPDGNWYASLEGDIDYSPSNNHFYHVNEIVVYSTSDVHEVYRISWSNEWMNIMDQSRTIHWLDNEHLVYEYVESVLSTSDANGAFVINPFTDEQTGWAGKDDIFYNSPIDFVSNHYQHISNDFRLSLATQGNPSEPWTTLNDVMTGEEIRHIDNLTDAIVWLPDTSGFVGIVQYAEDDRRIVLFDSQGEIQQELLLISSAYVPINSLAASPDSRYVAFVTDEYEELHQRSIRLLYLIDFAQREVIYTCLTSGQGVAWSPDGTQLAFTKPGSETVDVRVVDIETWSMQAITQHRVEDTYRDIVIGWRQDE